MTTQMNKSQAIAALRQAKEDLNDAIYFLAKTPYQYTDAVRTRTLATDLVRLMQHVHSVVEALGEGGITQVGRSPLVITDLGDGRSTTQAPITPAYTHQVVRTSVQSSAVVAFFTRESAAVREAKRLNDSQRGFANPYAFVVESIIPTAEAAEAVAKEA